MISFQRPSERGSTFDLPRLHYQQFQTADTCFLQLQKRWDKILCHKFDPTLVQLQ
eukprot:Awhi_evm1s11034